jgi:phosphoribosylanthranilate isomerase
MVRVKICGITNIENALEAVHAGADAIGLVFYEKSPRYVSIQKAAEICSALPPFVSTVGLFVNAEGDLVREVVTQVGIDLLQFHGEESPDYCKNFSRPYLKAIRVKPGTDLVQYATDYREAKGLLLDAYVPGKPGGTGTTFDWKLIPENLPLPVVLSGGLDSENVKDAIRSVKPWAVDVSSGVEKVPGLKDAIKIREFIKGVRDAGL